MLRKPLGIVGVLSLLVAASVTAARATDMPIKASPAHPAMGNWTDCYVGATIGGAWGRSSYSGSPTGDFTTPEPIGEPSIIPNLSAISSGALDPVSVIGGGGIGCNWQTGQVVFSLEADASAWNLSKQSVVTGAGDPEAPGSTLTATTSESSHWLATVRPRIGYAQNNWLFYVTGGAAFAQVTFAQTVFFNASNTAQSASTTNSLTGWTVGGGIEVSVSPNWLLKAEYLYVGFPTQTINEFNPSFPTFTETATNRLSGSIFRIGVDYKFRNLFLSKY
jgi:outer membrane immunogenic protein